MNLQSLMNRVGVGIWYVEAVVDLCAQAVALYYLKKKKNRKPADLLVLHLCCSEVFYVVWDLVNYSVSFYFQYASESTIHIVGNVVFASSFYQSVLWITFDRVIRIKYGLQYMQVFTNKKLAILLVLTWIISFSSGVINWFLPPGKHILMWIVQDSVSALVLIASYVYIIVKIHLRNKIFCKNSASSKMTFKIQIPLCIVLSLFCCFLIPDVILITNQDLYSVWFLIVWYLNFLFDPIIYVFFTRRRNERRMSSVSQTEDDRRISTISQMQDSDTNPPTQSI